LEVFTADLSSTTYKRAAGISGPTTASSTPLTCY